MHYLAHSSIAPAPAEQLFMHADRLLSGDRTGSGRGAALRFAVDDVRMVFKDYHRGGLPARIIRDSYAGCRLEATRMWREFRLLAHLEGLGLPVPTPIAARCTWRSPLTYRGDLITEELPDTTTLSACLGRAPLPPAVWGEIGGLVRRFHDHDVYHADLNASNILRDDGGRLFLLDFDKGRIRRPSDRWKQANLDRLRRSLAKIHRAAAGTGRAVHYSARDWEELLHGYHVRGPQPPATTGAEATADHPSA